MRQTTLWDSPEMSTALCRASDPETSRIAAEAMATALVGAIFGIAFWLFLIDRI